MCLLAPRVAVDENERICDGVPLAEIAGRLLKVEVVVGDRSERDEKRVFWGNLEALGIRLERAVELV